MVVKERVSEAKMQMGIWLRDKSTSKMMFRMKARTRTQSKSSILRCRKLWTVMCSKR